MKDALKFISPATRSGPILELEHEHYVIADGRITAHNRAMAISAPFPVEWSANPRADLFRAAVDKAGDTVGFEPQGRNLVVRSKGLKVAVPCLPDAPWTPQPQGELVEAPADLLTHLGACQPFVSPDPARKMLCSVLIGGGCYTAALNVGCVQLWTGHKLPTIHVPDYVLKEVLRIKDKPRAIQVSQFDVTFHYEGDRWIKGLTYEERFPWDTIQRILDPADPAACEDIPPDLPSALERLEPFLEDDQSIHFRDGGMATCRYAGEGAHVEVEGIPSGLVFGFKPLERTLAVARRINWADPDKRHHFFGDKLRGALMGKSRG